MIHKMVLHFESFLHHQLLQRAQTKISFQFILRNAEKHVSMNSVAARGVLGSIPGGCRPFNFRLDSEQEKERRYWATYYTYLAIGHQISYTPSIERIVELNNVQNIAFLLWSIMSCLCRKIPGFPRDTYSHSGRAWERGQCCNSVARHWLHKSGVLGSCRPFHFSILPCSTQKNFFFFLRILFLCVCVIDTCVHILWGDVGTRGGGGELWPQGIRCL